METKRSLIVRATAIFFGIIGLLLTVPILLKLSGLYALGPGILGVTSLIMGISLKCVKPVIEVPNTLNPKPTHFIKAVKEEHSLVLNKRHQAVENRVDLLEPPKYLTPPDDGSCPFSTLPTEMGVYIASFLEIKDLINAMRVSTRFCAIMRSNAIWNPILGDHRIWGATRWNLKRNDDKRTYSLEPENKTVNSDVSSFDQLCIYKELKKQKGFRGCKEDNFSSYLARLMPGGPKAFASLPDLFVGNPAKLAPEDMPAPVIRGVDKENRRFIALRLIDRARAESKPVVLVFIRDNGSFVWMQEANAYWRKDTLNVTHQDALNYVLALISRNSLDRSDFKSSALIKTIELADR